MNRETIQYDENGNFVFNGELEAQWMKLHRDIQAEYRNEQWSTFLKGASWVAGIVLTGYFLIESFNRWLY